MKDYSKLHYVECRNCHYKWRSTSQLAWITCPSCMAKTPNKPPTKMPLTYRAQKIEEALKNIKT